MAPYRRFHWILPLAAMAGACTPTPKPRPAAIVEVPPPPKSEAWKQIATPADEDRIQRFIRGQLAWLENLPWWFKLLLPSIVAALAWIVLAALFAELELVPQGTPRETIWLQAAAFSLAALLVWKWLLISFFMVHLVNIYLYIGTHPLWAYIGLTSRKLLLPLSFLRSGKLDLSPVAGLVAVFVLAEWWLEPLVLNVFKAHLR